VSVDLLTESSFASKTKIHLQSTIATTMSDNSIDLPQGDDDDDGISGIRQWG